MQRLVPALAKWRTIAAAYLAAMAGGYAAPPGPAVRAMGMTFPNPLGLAAGFDRTGAHAAQLGVLGFGHIEIGTFALPGRLSIARRRLPAGLRIGVNIGSRRCGIDPLVIEDYAAALRAAWPHADFVTVNLSSPFLHRHADTPRAGLLVARLAREAEVCAAESGRHVPLLLKISGGLDAGPIPEAVREARRCGFEGLVAVTPSLRRIAELTRFLDGGTLISAGGALPADGIKARLSAGAALVQIHTALLRGGPGVPRRLLAGLCPL